MSSVDSGAWSGDNGIMPPDPDQISHRLHVTLDGQPGRLAVIKSPDGDFVIETGTDDLPRYDPEGEWVGIGNQMTCVVRIFDAVLDNDGTQLKCETSIVETFDNGTTGYLGALAYVMSQIAGMT